MTYISDVSASRVEFKNFLGGSRIPLFILTSNPCLYIFLRVRLNLNASGQYQEYSPFPSENLTRFQSLSACSNYLHVQWPIFLLTSPDFSVFRFIFPLLLSFTSKISLLEKIVSTWNYKFAFSYFWKSFEKKIIVTIGKKVFFSAWNYFFHPSF